MAICLLVRHGRTTANAAGVLAGWSPEVDLDDHGRGQALAVGRRLRDTPLAAVVTSPLPRCRATTELLLEGREASAPVPVEVCDGLAEARYGAWTGRTLADLAKEPLWRAVQDAPSTVTFPADETFEHESMVAMADRAVAAVRDLDARIEDEHGPGAVWVAVSHGDVIKAVLAEACATPLDEFQRLVVDPASVSIVHRTARRPFVLRTNDTGSDPVDLSGLVARLTSREAGDAGGPGDEGDAPVGGGAGST